MLVESGWAPAPRPFLPDLIPAPLWGSNARAVLGTTRWRKLAGAVYASAGEDGCEYCGSPPGPGKLAAHEAWAYEISAGVGVQRLVGLLALCAPCHEAKHYGRATKIGRGAEALARLAALNGWGEARAQAAVAACWEEWRERNRVRAWTTDVSLALGLLGTPRSG